MSGAGGLFACFGSCFGPSKDVQAGVSVPVKASRENQQLHLEASSRKPAEPVKAVQYSTTSAGDPGLATLHVSIPAAPEAAELRLLLDEAKQQTSAAEDHYKPAAWTAEPQAPSLPQLPTSAQAQEPSPPDEAWWQQFSAALSDIRSWLAATNTITAADSAAKIALSSTCCDAQAALLSTPAERYTASHMAAGLQLLLLYSELAQHALNPRAYAKPLRLAMQQGLMQSPQPLSLLLRQLELAHQSPTHAAARQHAHCSLILWEVLRRFARLAVAVAGQSDAPGAEAEADQLAMWQQPLAQLAGQSGPLMAALAAPYSSSGVGTYMAGYHALRSLYELQACGLTGQMDAAQHYVRLHFLEFKRCHQAAQADPRSASAELCRLHLRLLLAAVSTQSLAVRAQLQQLGAVEMLLEEFSLEAKLYSLETAQAALDTPRDQDATHSLADSDSAPSSTDQLPLDAPPSPFAVAMRDEDLSWLNQPFQLTYDLEEDARRLEIYERYHGKTVELPGLEYDAEEQARAAAQKESPQVTLSPTPPTDPRPRPNLPPLKLTLSVNSARYTPPQPSGRSTSDAVSTPTRTSGVPRLPLGSLKSAASSRIVTPNHHAADGTRSAFHSARSQFASPDGDLRGSTQLSPHGGMTSLEVPSTSRTARTSDMSSLLRGSYKLRSHASHGLMEAALSAAYTPTAAAVLSSNSGHLHHSHLSPLSTRRSMGPSPRTTVLSIPQPSSPPHTLMPTESINRAPLPSSRLAATSFGNDVLPLHPASVDSTQLSNPGDRSDHLPLADANGAPASPEFISQATCAHFLHSTAGSDEVGAEDLEQGSPAAADLRAVNSEAADWVPDLMPRPPGATQAAAPGGQAGRGLGSGSGSRQSVPALNLGALSAGDSTAPKGAPLSASSQVPLTSGGTITDSAMNPNHLPPSPLSQLQDSAKLSSHGQAAGSYRAALLQKLWYHDMTLHACMLRLLLSLLVTPGGGLDSAYWQPFPADAGISNTEHALMWHFVGPPGTAILPDLLQLLVSAASRGPATTTAAATALGAVRVLRLVARGLFDASRYQDMVFHAHGAYGALYRAKVVDPATGSTQQVMIKSLELPASGYDRCVLPEVYGEVYILDKYATQWSLPVVLPPDLQRALAALAPTTHGHQGVCQLHDYGVTQNAYWLVLRRYRCSLAEWRAKQPRAQGPAAVALYLAVVLQVIDTMLVLAADAVVHFDLKAANVLVEPLEGVKDGQLYGPPPPPPCQPYFRAVLADFGEARAYRNAEEAYTVRNRGTEMYKSPEMLLMHSKPISQPGTPHRAGAGPGSHRGHTGAGLASDVWSLGCLTYEVLAGKPLFAEADYASVTHRVAFGPGPYLQLSAAEVAALGPEGESCLKGLIEEILVRDPGQRPQLKAVQAMVQQARECVLAKAIARTQV